MELPDYLPVWAYTSVESGWQLNAIKLSRPAWKSQQVGRYVPKPKQRLGSHGNFKGRAGRQGGLGWSGIILRVSRDD